MNVKPLVSVIIPNYNHALFLGQRIDSVLNQTCQDFEVIILDDCSTDQSREVIEGYRSHPKINQIIYNEKNSGGVFKQWINGIEKAKGEYVWIAESDDFAAETFLEETVNALENNDVVGMVFTNTNTVNTNGEFIITSAQSKAKSYAKLATFNNIIDKGNISLFLVSDMIIENASSVLFRKKTLLQINFDELTKFINTGDRFVYLGIALHSTIKYIPQPLNYMRSHGSNTTKASIINGNIHKDRVRVLSYYFDQLCTTSFNRKNVVAFYKTNYLSFIHYGEYQHNVILLKKLKAKHEIQNSLYRLVMCNLFLFKKMNIKSKILRGLYYRILIAQK